jgi:hypothetical protein
MHYRQQTIDSIHSLLLLDGNAALGEIVGALVGNDEYAVHNKYIVMVYNSSYLMNRME